MMRAFPIRLDNDIKQIPWSVLQPHEAQCLANTGKDLEQMASAGGLTPEEAIAIIEGRPWERMALTYAGLRLRELVTSACNYAKLVHDLEAGSLRLHAWGQGRKPDVASLEALERTLTDAAMTLRSLM